MKALKLLTFIGVAAILASCLGNPTGGGTGGEGLTGVIVDPQGSPVSGAVVSLYPESTLVADNVMPKQATTDESGRFEFKKLARARYNLHATSPQSDTTLLVFVPGIHVGKVADAGSNVLRLPGRLTLRVVDEFNLPQAGARCEVPGSPWNVLSDSAGTCQFEDLAAGVFRIQVAQLGLSRVTDTLSVLSGETRDGGVAVLDAAAETIGVPANWLHVSALAYDFYLPPNLKIAAEGFSDSGSSAIWTGTHQSESMHLRIVLGMSETPALPKGFPEYSEKVLWDESGSSAVLFTARIPEDQGAPQGRYLSGVYVKGTPAPFFSLMNGTFLVTAQTREEQSRGACLLETVRRWQGPGVIPLSRPAPPAAAVPNDGDSVTVDSVLSWHNMRPSTVTSYRVQVYQDTTQAPVHEETVVPDAVSKTFHSRFSSAPLKLLPGSYFWRVTAEGRGGSTPSPWRRIVVHSWKHFAWDGYTFQGPVDWARSDSSRIPDSAWIRYSTFSNAGGWLRLVETNERQKPDLSLKANLTVEEIAWESGRATLTRFTETQGSQTVQGARVDLWTLSEEESWVENPNFWLEAGASTSLGWLEIREAIATFRDAGLRPNPPARRTLTSPASGATGVALSPTLSWKAIDMNDFGTYFRVQVFVDSPYAAMVLSDSVHRSSTSRDTENYHHTVGPLKPGTTYSWRVRAWGANPRVPGDTSTSELWKFTTTTSQ